ncbi:MAG: transcription termination/antitermination protein NusA [Bacteroidetes bacterium]|nr:transcription termination/antitermination protein NusA [Bacteroidota bacterium]
MLDLKALKSALLQMEEERKIPREKIIDAIEQSLAAAYKKDYGKKGQIIRVNLDLDSGGMEFYQVKIVADETTVRFLEEGEEADFSDDDKQTSKRNHDEEMVPNPDEPEMLPVFNPEKHILLEDARKIKKGVELGEEITFPLDLKDDFGRIAAQTAKQVIIQRIREAERGAVMEEYGGKEGGIVSGIVQKVDRGVIFVDFPRATGVLARDEQIFGERFMPGQRVKAYLLAVEETGRGVNLELSRSHPGFLESLFSIESPEIASGVVEIKSIAREAGSRSKIAVFSHDENVDPIGACVGQKGVRVTTVMNELGGEKIDIIEWSDNLEDFIAASLSPAKILNIEVKPEEKVATIEVASDQLSLAIGKGGQNVRLAAKLTGFRIDIKGGEKDLTEEENDAVSNEETSEISAEEIVEEATEEITNDSENN